MTAPALWFLDGRVTIHVAAAANADGLSVTEHRMPGGFGPPYHVHRDEDETLYFLEGRFRLCLDGAVREAGAGEVAFFPRGLPHGFRVLSPDGGRILTVTRGGFEAMVRAVARPAAHDGLPPPAPPTPELARHLDQVCAENGIDLLGPPIP